MNIKAYLIEFYNFIFFDIDHKYRVSSKKDNDECILYKRINILTFNLFSRQSARIHTQAHLIILNLSSLCLSSLYLDKHVLPCYNASIQSISFNAPLHNFRSTIYHLSECEWVVTKYVKNAKKLIIVIFSLKEF